MNKLDKDYHALLQDIMNNGVSKSDRTGTGTISVFGRQIRHSFKDGRFPLLTTKRIPFKLVVTELLWFLRGDTNIKYLVDNDCHIWDGDAYKNFKSKTYPQSSGLNEFDKEDFIIAIKNGNYSEYNLGDLGPIYGKQWREWDGIDQIQNLINDLKTNPDSRRLMVSAWNVGELDQMVLPPCHYGFQVWTRKLSLKERLNLVSTIIGEEKIRTHEDNLERVEKLNIPTRAISLMWNQRSVDTFLGLPFNIASYGLLLEIIAKTVNMVPDELIGNLGDTHLYLNHIDQAKLQISRELDLEERRAMVTQEMFNQIYNGGGPETLSHSECDQWNIPKVVTREPYPLPKLEINTEFLPTESGECGIGNLTNNIDFLIKNLQIEDFQIVGYQSHPAIKAPLSN